jgi:hypothetical protein
MAYESYRLRALAFRWEKLEGVDKACDEFGWYKGEAYCHRCHQTMQAHAIKQCVRELRALLAEPEIELTTT